MTTFFANAVGITTTTPTRLVESVDFDRIVLVRATGTHTHIGFTDDGCLFLLPAINGGEGLDSPPVSLVLPADTELWGTITDGDDDAIVYVLVSGSPG